MESIYKVGDKVTIRSVLHPGSTEYDYPYGFTDRMLEQYGGKSFTIRSVCRVASAYSVLRHYVEPFCYYLDGIPFTWNAAMFEIMPTQPTIF